MTALSPHTASSGHLWHNPQPSTAPKSPGVRDGIEEDPRLDRSTIIEKALTSQSHPFEQFAPKNEFYSAYPGDETEKAAEYHDFPLVCSVQSYNQTGE